MKESIKSIIEWHEKTFPNATLDGQLTKFDEELNEYNEDVNMLELADMFIVACGIARFNSVMAVDYFALVAKALRDWETLGSRVLLGEVVDEKMKKNRKRVWEKKDGLYKHKRGIND